MPRRPFVIDPYLTGITLAFRNPSSALIADLVLPRVTVLKEEFAYNTFPLEDSFTIPDTRIGRTSQPNQIEFSADRKTAQTEDHGLEDPIPYSDIETARGTGYDPEARAVEGLTDLLLLAREVRAANLIFNPSSYADSAKAKLKPEEQWNAEKSDPIKAMEDAIDSQMIKPNKLVLGRAAWSQLKRHPKVVSAILGNANTSGRVTRQAFAEILELSEVVVGEGWVNTARKGQNPKMARAWGKHASLLYVNPNADTDRGFTFGVTAQYKKRVGMRYEDEKIGLEGGVVIRVGEKLKELVIGNSLGYFFENAVA